MSKNLKLILEELEVRMLFEQDEEEDPFAEDEPADEAAEEEGGEEEAAARYRSLQGTQRRQRTLPRWCPSECQRRGNSCQVCLQGPQGSPQGEGGACGRAFAREGRQLGLVIGGRMVRG